MAKLIPVDEFGLTGTTTLRKLANWGCVNIYNCLTCWQSR